MRPGQDERIAHLFRRGYSMDLVSELGLLYGWTRKEARSVVADNGWSLDWSGRLQQQHIKESMPVWPTVATADSERLLNAGVDHENPIIRKVALAAERAIEKLRSVLMALEKEDAQQAASKALGYAFGTSTGVEEVRVS